MRCMITAGLAPENKCLDCSHFVGSHLFPTGICMECAEFQLARLDMTEEMHTRVDQLGFAVQVLTERLDAGRLAEMERRLDEFVSSWPKQGVPSA